LSAEASREGGWNPAMNSLTHEQAAAKQCHLTPAGVLEGLEPAQVTDLESMGIHMEYHRELVVADAHEIQYFFYIVKGNFEVSKVSPETKKKTVLATIGEGQSFGEMSFLTGAMASANVMANDEVVAWAIPHASLRQFIETHPGGVRLGLNIATQLAHRIQEGNTRLMGMTATLSAYFGATARASEDKTREAPQATDHAEMEIPDEVFDGFARDCLGLRPEESLTEAHRDQIRAKIETNEVDIVPWLEKGGSGQRLKVRLKFVADQAPRVAVAAAAPAAAAAVAKPMVVRVPQVRARIAPAIAYAMRPPSLAARLLNIGSYVAIPPLTAFALFHFLPFDSRESIAKSPGYQNMPLQSVCNWFVFSTSSQSQKIVLKNGAAYSLGLYIPKTARLVARMDFPQKNGVPMQLTIRVAGRPDTPPLQVQLAPGTDSVELCSMRLEPGKYTFECTCGEAAAGAQAEAVLTIQTRS
jgi:CRP-like cAMP-binding protein